MGLTPQELEKRYKQNDVLERQYQESNMSKVSEALSQQYDQEEIDTELCNESYEIDEQWIKEIEDDK